MEISKLFKTQEENNQTLRIDPSLTDYKLFARKHLQIHIELSTLATETQCYKYWIHDEDEDYIDENFLFKKYISCLKQIFSLGLDNGYNYITDVNVSPNNDGCLSDQFLSLYIDVNDMIISPSEDHFTTLLEDYLTLGLSLGFDEESISSGFCRYSNLEIAL